MTPVNPPFAGKALAVLAAFSLGIVAGVTWPADPVRVLAAAVCGLAVLVAVRGHDRAGTTMALVAAILAGMAAVSVQAERSRSFDPPGELANRLVSVSGAITTTPRIRGGATMFVMSCDSLYVGGTVYHAGGAVPCTVLGRELAAFEGDRVVFRGMLRSDPRSIGDGAIIRPPSPYENRWRLVASPSAGDPVVFAAGRGPIIRIRQALAATIDRLPFGGYGDLVKAMTIGDTGGLDPVVRDMFTRAGIAHLLAVSGLHAGIVALAVLALFSMAGAGRPVRLWGVMFCVIVYAAICGFRPPVVRAAVMSSLAMGALLIERRVPAEHTLSIAALVILACNPLALFGPSFQMSFASVWIIVTFHQPVMACLRERSAWFGPRHRAAAAFASLLVVSLLASIGTAPVAAVHFAVVPLLSVPVNVLAVPLAFPVVYLGAGAVILAWVGPVAAPVAWVAAAGAGLCLRVLTGLAGMVAAIPFSSVAVGSFGPLAAAGTMIWLFLLSRAPGRRRVRRALVYLPLTVLLVVTWQPLIAPAGGDDGASRIVFFDVGQGDAALVSLPGGRHFLVDTGTASAGKYVVAPGLLALGVDRLDGIFVSHLDSDHAGGLAAVLAALPVDRVFCTAGMADSLAMQFDCEIAGLAAGDSVGVTGGGFAVLSPPSQGVLARLGAMDDNNASLVVRCDTGGIGVLFTGDIESESQALLEAWGERLAAGVLKVPHHGAARLDTDFVRTVRPGIAVISCGLNNRYGHPAPETVAFLESAGATVLRTDRDGPLAIVPDRGETAIMPLSR